MSISVKIVADSTNPNGNRITSFLLRYPRFIHCYDDATDVLCEFEGVRKFRRWADVVNTSAKLAVFHPQGRKITFETPSQWVNEQSNGEMVTLENQRLSFSVTENHRMYVGSRKSWGDEWEVIEAKELLCSHTQKRFETSGFVQSLVRTTPLLCRLLGFFVGDGNLPKAGHQAIFHLKKKRKIKYLHNILTDLGIPYDFKPYLDGTSNTSFIRTPEMNDCYSSDGQKQIPGYVLNSDPESMLAFLHGLWFSDGSTDKGECRIFNTSSAHVADQLTALAAMCGEHINCKGSYDHGMFKLTRCIEKQPILRCDKHQTKLTRYDGRVYCASVSSGLLVIRRQGIVHVSGNSEFMTHRVFSRNAASSRAIPVKRIIQDILDDPAMPVFWGKAQQGMQAAEELDGIGIMNCQSVWLEARDKAIDYANALISNGLHKQIANRILEPWAHMTTLATATELGNFFNLRVHKDAQPEFQKLAKTMLEAYTENKPEAKNWNEWHIPFGDRDLPEMSLQTKLKVCTARAARTSYQNFEGQIDIAKDIELHDRLALSGHFSPFEHCAMAVIENRGISNFNPHWYQYRKTLARENQDKFDARTLLEGVKTHVK